MSDLLPHRCVRAYDRIGAIMKHSRDDSVTIIEQIARICDEALRSKAKDHSGGGE